MYLTKQKWLTKIQKQFNRGKIDFSVNDVGATGHPQAKKLSSI